MTTSTPRERKVARAGVDPIERIFSIEDHDAAYDVWKAEGVRAPTLPRATENSFNADPLVNETRSGGRNPVLRQR